MASNNKLVEKYLSFWSKESIKFVPLEGVLKALINHHSKHARRPRG